MTDTLIKLFIIYVSLYCYSFPGPLSHYRQYWGYFLLRR